MPRLSLIAAIAQNGGIGKDGDLLYHLPADMRRFKSLTTGHTVVMGRRTFESLPKGALPNRRNMVLSTQPGAEFPGAECFSSIEKAIEAARTNETEEEIFVIGGYSVYKVAMPMADRLYLTTVDHSGEQADTFFPDLDPTEWETTEMEEHPADEKHAYPYVFLTLERKKR